MVFGGERGRRRPSTPSPARPIARCIEPGGMANHAWFAANHPTANRPSTRVTRVRGSAGRCRDDRGGSRRSLVRRRSAAVLIRSGKHPAENRGRRAVLDGSRVRTTVEQGWRRSHDRVDAVHPGTAGRRDEPGRPEFTTGTSLEEIGRLGPGRVSTRRPRGSGGTSTTRDRRPYAPTACLSAASTPLLTHRTSPSTTSDARPRGSVHSPTSSSQPGRPEVRLST